MKSWLSLRAALLAVLALTLAACGPAATPTPKVTPTPAASPTPSGPKGQLRVATSEFSREEFDPANFPIGSWSHNVGYPMFDSLIGAKADASLAPGLAERWEMAGDGLAWTFYLRRNAKFHNGDPVTAADVKFSLERYMEPTATISSAASLRTSVAGIDVVDDNTLRVRLKAPDPYLPLLLAPLQTSLGFVMPKKYFEEKGLEYFKRNPVGSGPFKFVRHVLGDRVELEATTQHWRKVPAVKDLTVMLVPQEATAAAMLRSGQADIVEISAERIKEMEGAGFRVDRIPTTQVATLQFYGTYMQGAGAMADVRVRQALSLAINRDEIVKFVAGGGASPAPSAPYIYPFSFDLSIKEWEPAVAYDPDRARKLLQEAGYPQGFKIKLYSFPLSGIPWLTKMAEITADYWGKIGVTTELVPTEYGAFRPNVTPATKPAMVGQASVFRSPATWNISPMFRSIYHDKGNLHLIKDPEFDRLLEASAAELDAAKRQEMVRQVVKISRDSQTALAIAYVDGLFGLSPKIASWQPMTGLVFIGPAFETVTWK